MDEYLCCSSCDWCGFGENVFDFDFEYARLVSAALVLIGANYKAE
jgi:hypothetical protein